MSEPDFAEEVDQVLAQLRRVILRAAERGGHAVAASASGGVAKRAPQVPVRVIPPRASRATPDPAETREDVTANGVTVSFRHLTVTHGGRSVVVAMRPLEMLAVLVKAKPNVVPRAEICRRAWPDIRQDSGMTLFSGFVPRLEQLLPEIGLRLNTVRGFGLSLTTLEGR